MSQLLIRYSRILEIIGDIVKVHVPASEAGASQISFGDLALIEGSQDTQDVLPRTAQVILLKGEEVSLQVFSGTKGLSTHSVVRFLTWSGAKNMVGRGPGRSPAPPRSCTWLAPTAQL